MKKISVVIDACDAPCPRCGRRMQSRKHNFIGPKQLRQPFYFTRWFCCTYGDCRTTIVHKETFKVINLGQRPKLRT
jgi:hypothetical protein